MDNSAEKRNMEQSTIATITTPDLGIPFQACLVEDSPDPCTIVIVGASGDLTARKLVPALYNLFLRDALPNPFLIVGCSRSKLTEQAFREKRKCFSRMNPGAPAQGLLRNCKRNHTKRFNRLE